MKIRVQRYDGNIETLALVPPFKVREPNYEVPEGVKRLAVIECGDGTDHYFVEGSGYYDGWGRGVGGAQTMEDAIQTIANVEGDRQIEPGGAASGNGQ